MRILLALIAVIGVQGRAHATWHVATTNHFVIYSQEKPERLRDYAEKLERFDRLLRVMQAIPERPTDPATRLTIYALGSMQLHSVLGHMPNVAGIYHPSYSGSVALTSIDKDSGIDAQIILLHEYAHHFMQANAPATYPSWFVEGYAEFVSTAIFEANGDISYGIPALHRLDELRILRQGNPVPLRAMMEGRSRIDGLFETKGWLLTHYLAFDHERSGQLAAFLQALNEGRSATEAARVAFGDLGKLDRDLDVYSRMPKLPYLRISAALIPPGEVTIGDVTPGEAAIMAVRMNSRLGVGPTEARQRVIQAERIAKSYPADPAVQCALAEAEDDAGQAIETDATAHRLLAQDPKSVCAMIFAGRATMARARLAKAAADAPVWNEARAWFTRANRADVENPWPMALYYLSYREAGARATPNAIAALMGAIARAPQDSRLRLFAAVELLHQGKSAEARRIIAPLAGAAHIQSAGTISIPTLEERIATEDPRKLADEIEQTLGRRDTP